MLIRHIISPCLEPGVTPDFQMRRQAQRGCAPGLMSHSCREPYDKARVTGTCMYLTAAGRHHTGRENDVRVGSCAHAHMYPQPKFRACPLGAVAFHAVNAGERLCPLHGHSSPATILGEVSPSWPGFQVTAVWGVPVGPLTGSLAGSAPAAACVRGLMPLPLR